MLFLFANLPSTATIPPKTIALCQRLCLEFEHYLIVSHSLRKSFLSIKGIYYQATIQGQDILWLVPYKFVQRVTGDIDFRIMGTFIEFYTTLLGFVNYRLYNSVGLIYPPKFDAASDERGGELGAFTLQGRDLDSTLQLENGTDDTAMEDASTAPTTEATERAQAAANTLTTTAETVEEPADDLVEAPTTAIDTFTAAGADADILPQPAAPNAETTSIFAPFTFFLSRETPRQPLEFLLKAFGSRRVAWDAVLGDGSLSVNEADPSITHQIVDRPPQPIDADAEDANIAAHHARRVPGRTYVQPQWVWDCINEGKLLRPDLYAPGATLPPHLSPWVKPTKGVYDPTAPLPSEDAEQDAIAAEAAEVEDHDDDDESDEVDGDGDTANGIDSIKALADLNGAEAEASDSDSASAAADATEPALADDFGGFDDSEAEADEESAQAQRQRELLAEASGQAVSANATPGDAGDAAARKKQKAAAQAKKRKDEEVERAKMMMPRRKRKLFEKMQYSNAKRDAETEKLQQKRRKVEAARGA